jgi:ParB family transcriptional regulator, chromosome partitioning protein
VAKPKKRGLGKGLGALIGDNIPSLTELSSAIDSEGAQNTVLPDGSELLWLDPRDIRPNPKQPRRVFDEEALAELAESIRRDGIQEPVIVRLAEGQYELVSGERRVRASVMAGLEHVPAIRRDVSDADMLKLGLIENIQREDLNAIELAVAYRDLIQEFGWTQEELADEVGKKRATVANVLRLLNLPEVIQEMVADASLSMGHARALLAIEAVQDQIAAAHKIIRQGLSVRQAEQLAAPKTAKAKAAKDPNIVHIEDELRRSLGTKVALKPQNAGRGRIEIEYFNADELERLLAILRGKR